MNSPVAVSFSTIVLIALIVLAILVVAGIVIAFAFSLRRSDHGTNPHEAPCPKCQELVPLDAEACPRCGHVMKTG